MKIIQITDLHLSGPEDTPDSSDYNSWQRWSRLAEYIEKRKPDLIVNTGDICLQNPQMSIYKKFFDSLKGFSTPLRLVAGNHDDLSMLQSALPAETATETKVDCEGFTCLFLDCENGRLIPSHQSLLFETLSSGSAPLILFMHYPPVYAGSPFMDQNYPFQQIDTLLPEIKNANRPIHVFCGHYHTDRIIQTGACNIYITPSPYKNIDPAFETKTTAVDRGLPFREIHLNQSIIQQELHYLPSKI
jgi:Icc protein